MIYHQLFHPPKNRGLIEWWAVQTPTFAIVRCTVDEAGRLHIGHVPRSVPVAAHLTGDPPPDNLPVNCEAIEAELCESIRNHFGYELHPGRSGNCEEPLPEHILITDDTGEDKLPGILRTTDPTFIVWPEPQPAFSLGGPPCGILGIPVIARSSRQLPSRGWQYWWEEAQDALETLTDEYLAAERRYLAD